MRLLFSLFFQCSTLAGISSRVPVLAKKVDLDIGDRANINPSFDQLPWDELHASIGTETHMIDVSNEDYVAECYPEFKDTPAEERSVWDLKAKPSGLCMGALLTAFKNANPVEAEGSLNEDLEQMSHEETRDELVMDVTNPKYNLPQKVIFPRTAGDVVAAVEFAASHSLELSVKNSGHSFAGSSTKADTLLVNMRDFKPYSPTNLIECQGIEDIADDLSNQPCQVALSRGKNAYIRVGGGESWSDVYVSVKDFNEEQESYKYHVVGGGAGTVSPMGWTWQGGLGGTTGSRLYGFGVDQVIQIEAVLPNGSHVRFGPTAWEDEEGYDYPKTTEVTGLCNQYPFESDESLWEWDLCEGEMNFDDLWFAFRGAGFGTFGVVTSASIQLHPYLPFRLISLEEEMFAEYCNIEMNDSMTLARNTFYFNYLLDPSSLRGVTSEDSNACGSPHGASGLTWFCYGDVDDTILAAWEMFISDHTKTLEDGGTSIETMLEFASCPRSFFPLLPTYNDYAELILLKDGPHAGKAADNPPPYECSSIYCSFFLYNILFPMNQIDDLFKEGVLPVLHDPFIKPYFAFGGHAATAHDQTTSLSDAHRNAGMMMFFPPEFEEVIYELYDFSGDEFPAYMGANHLHPFARGPMKNDWSQLCSMDMTQEERDEKCMPIQEIVWGSKTLRRLEAIKEKVDPNYMFDCTTCVGNNRKRKELLNNAYDHDASVIEFA